MNTIVVGVDHSEGAKAALRFALEEAKLRGARLRVVHAWQFGGAEEWNHWSGHGEAVDAPATSRSRSRIG